MSGRPTPPRMRERFTVQAIKRVAEDRNTDRLEIEDMYARARTAIVHLHVDDIYPVEHNRIIDAKLNDLLATNDRFLAAARKDGTLNPRWLNEVERRAGKLKPAWDRDKQDHQVTQTDIAVFLAVLNEAIRQHVATGYDPAGIFDPKMLLLAHMVMENFAAYDMTLNT